MIRITVSGDNLVLAKFTALPSIARQKIVSAMMKQWMLLQRTVVGKLSNDVLRRVTGNLASSINVGGQNSRTEFTETPAVITGQVGTKVTYARVHEDGGTFDVKAHDRRVSQVYGRLLQSPVVAHVRAYQMTMPQRSFLRSSLAERAPGIRAALEQAVREMANAA